MNISSASASSSHIVFCSSDKSTCIVDNYETQTRLCWRSSRGKYDFIMKDGTKNTLQRALHRLNPETKLYFTSRFNLSEIPLDSTLGTNLMAELYNRDIISEDEMVEYTCVNDGLVPVPGVGDMGRVKDEPNIYQTFKQMAVEKKEKALHLQGDEKEAMSKRAEMYSRLAGILKGIFGEVQSIVYNGEDYSKRLEDLNPPGIAAERNGELMKNVLAHSKSNINKALDEMVTPHETAEEKKRRLELWKKEHLDQELKNRLHGHSI